MPPTAEHRFLSNGADHAGVERLRAEQLRGRFAEHLGHFLDLRQRPWAVAAQLAVPLRKTQVENAAKLRGLLPLADAVTAHQLAHAFRDCDGVR